MTIWMLYTAWALIIATGLLWRLLIGKRCQHQWKLVDKIEFPSQLEELHKSGCTAKEGSPVGPLTRKKVVSLIGCDTCGARDVLTFHSAD